MDITQLIREAFLGGIFTGVISLLALQLGWKALREPSFKEEGKDADGKEGPAAPERNNVYRFNDHRHG